jgi:hypothetical protein
VGFLASLSKVKSRDFLHPDTFDSEITVFNSQRARNPIPIDEEPGTTFNFLITPKVRLNSEK